MKALKLMPLFCLLFLHCSGQDKQKKAEKTIKPNENIQVNKAYDAFGNLIKYDSIYSYSYSSNDTLNNRIKMQFQKHFNNHSFFNDSFYNDFFGRDSITGGFNSKDFFHDGFMNQNDQIKSMMQRMDSIQQLFFNQHARPIIPAEPEKQKPSTEKINFKQI
ncbi:MAG: hypothetical protein P8K68_04020 [Algibacter sp.]|uniref:hypothetical protein n=1 Tax=Algibacter sp. TaxID=1872428 RepID=UPI00260C3A58|nr:hypothetical protein [Algibacter sp.]MDG1729786.1 hypothetical protein [Algibacter sp.]MDG2177940.1 hypothetical protein [Algibacter sp.]